MSTHAPLAKPRSPRRRRLMWFNAALAATLFGLWWRFRPVPSFGGGEVESPQAQAMKETVYESVSRDDEAGFSRIDIENPGGWLLAFKEPLQPLEAYQNGNPIRPTSARRMLVIQPVEPISQEQKSLLPTLRLYTEACFQLPVRVAPPLKLAQEETRGGAYEGRAGGRQRNAGAILNAVAPLLPSDAVALFCVTGSDLWASDLSYVFGLGDFNRRVGVYSLCRYFPEFWGKKRQAGDQTQALKRACRVLNHEIGHIFGMTHCVFYKCSMNGANSLGESDGQPIDYCPVCHRKLMWNIGWNGAKRYSQLEQFFANHEMPLEAQWFASRLQHWRRVAEREGVQ